MLLAWAVSCDSYELHDDGTADIFAAGFDTFRVDALPAELDLAVLLRSCCSRTKKANWRSTVLGPDTTPLGNLAFTITADPGPDHRPGYTVSQIEALKLVFLAETEGIYSVELYVGHSAGNATSEERRRSIFFNVREGLPERD